MSTLTAHRADAAETASIDLGPTIEAGAARRPLSSHVNPIQTVAQTMTMAWRSAIKMIRQPEQFFDVLVQPILFTLMFAYVFGGAISGNVTAYLPLMIPGIMATSMLTACMATGVQLREDMEKGVFNRFKVLPMARIAPLAGPMVADLLRYAIVAVLTIAMGLIMGYRPGGGFLGVAAGCLVAILAGWSLAWLFTFVGVLMRSSRAVQGVSMMIMFPLSFVSNAYVPTGSMPKALQVFVSINPVSHVVAAVRDLANTGQFTAQVGFALLGCVIVVAIFAPLSVLAYKKKA